MEMTRCPECGAPAEVDARSVLESTDGPIEHARVRCLQRHVFVLPVEWLAREPRTPLVASRPDTATRVGSERRSER
jgi:hypothetical protein